MDSCGGLLRRAADVVPLVNGLCVDVLALAVEATGEVAVGATEVLDGVSLPRAADAAGGLCEGRAEPGIGVAVGATDVLGEVSLPRAAVAAAGIRDGRAVAAPMGVAVGALLGFAPDCCASDTLDATGVFVWVVAALGLGVSRFTDAERGGERLLRVPPGRVSVEELVAGGRCDAGGAEGRCKPAGFTSGFCADGAELAGIWAASLDALIRVAAVETIADAGASVDSEPQSESTSSVLGVEATGEFSFDNSPDDAG